MFKDKIILITGQGGSFGTAMTKKLLEIGVKKIIAINKAELVEFNSRKKFKDERIKYYNADITNKELMEKIFNIEKPNIVYLAGAMKFIDICAENPESCINTNVIANMNLINIAIKNKCETIVFLSTDKACNSISLYGTSKMIIEQYCQCVNAEDTKIIRTRYGNVCGSNGSVIPTFKENARNNKPLEIVVNEKGESHTRLFMSMDEAIDTVLFATNCNNGDLVCYNNKSANIQEIADLISNNQIKKEERTKEKTDEALLTVRELNHSKMIDNYYIVNDNIISEKKYTEILTSDNAKRYSMCELKELIDKC